MKTIHAILTLVFVMVLSANLNAQSNTDINFFKGSWKAVVENTPAGDVSMVISFDQNDEIKASINDASGNELYKVVSTTIKENQATLIFIGSQGEVDMNLKKKDEDHLTGNIMGMYYLDCERVNETD